MSLPIPQRSPYHGALLFRCSECGKLIHPDDGIILTDDEEAVAECVDAARNHKPIGNPFRALHRWCANHSEVANPYMNTSDVLTEEDYHANIDVLLVMVEMGL